MPDGRNKKKTNLMPDGQNEKKQIWFQLDKMKKKI